MKFHNPPQKTIEHIFVRETQCLNKKELLPSETMYFKKHDINMPDSMFKRYVCCHCTGNKWKCDHYVRRMINYVGKL